MSRSVVISIKTLLRVGWRLLQQLWNLTLSCMISGLHKVDAFICSNLLIMQISAGQHFMQPKSNNIFSLLWDVDMLGPVFSLLHHFLCQLMCDGYLFAECLLCQTQLIMLLASWYLFQSKKNKIICGLQSNATYRIWIRHKNCCTSKPCRFVTLVTKWSKAGPNLAAALTHLKLIAQWHTRCILQEKGKKKMHWHVLGNVLLD